jgi:hypothetical protein
VRRRILVIPAVQDLDSFGRLIAHLGHYFGHVNAEKVTVLVEAAVLPQAQEWLLSPVLPPGYADRVSNKIAAIRERIALVSFPANVDSIARASDVVLDWNVRRSDSDPWAAIKQRYRADRTQFNIDWQGIRLGAAHIAEAAKQVGQGRTFDRSHATSFEGLVQRLGRARRAYLVGTGPSAREALEHDLSDGIRIICNTLVLDDELMEHVRPNILTFADPIFHFGPSTYVQRFQDAVLEQAAKHDFAIVTTERYVPLLRAHAPSIADRVIGVRQGGAGWPDNFDLRTNLAVKPYPNVLTMLMLPLAATVADEIGMIGFDGRDPRDNYFWRHGPTVQLDQELQDIRLVHPGFFEIDYADYYEDHIATVERLLSQLDVRGKTTRPLVESFIPALRRRLAAHAEVRPIPASETRSVLVSITPDWIGTFGHFGPFERRVHEAAEAAGLVHHALASQGLLPDAEWQVPTFSEATFASGSRYGPVGQRFEGELRGALEKLHLPPGSVVFMYTADVWHLPSILAVALELPGVRFVVNLQRAHEWMTSIVHEPDPWVEEMAGLLRDCAAVAEGLDVDICVDTETFQRDVQRQTGHVLKVWPMMAVSRMPEPGAVAHEGNGSNGTNGAKHIVSPIQAQSAKGFPELVALAERLHGRLDRGELRFTARAPVAGLGGSINRAAERIARQGVHLVKGNMTDAEYVDLVASADLVLIPYQVRQFRTKTSGVTIDALLAGKPVVATRGTWAGGLVERFGAGLTYTEGDVGSMQSAVSEVIRDIDAYRTRVAEIRDVVAAEHDPKQLLDFLRPGSGSATLDPEVSRRVQVIRDRVEAMRRAYRWHAVSESATKVGAAVREDELQRSIDALKDQVDGQSRDAGPGPRGRAGSKAGGRRDEAPSLVRSLKRRASPRTRAMWRASRGPLRSALMASGFLGLLAGAFAIGGYVVPAMLALLVAFLGALVAILVVAVRVERRL